jgi:hypothetical protein
VGLTGFSYVVDEHIGLMMRTNLPNFVRWYVRQIVLSLKTRPWAALRLFALMPFSLLRVVLIIPALGKILIQSGLPLS